MISVVGILFAIAYWPSPVETLNFATEEPKQEPIKFPTHSVAKDIHDEISEKQQLEKARKLLDEFHPKEALTIIRQHEAEINDLSQTGKQWLDLFIKASSQLHDTEQLAILYDYFPKAFQNHEKAVLMIADAYISSNRLKDYQKIRNRWKRQTKQENAWLVLDADKLLLEGKKEEAIALLNANSFEGKADTGRLVRLALLNAREAPKSAWKYLTEAYKKDPHNADIRSYRAKLLEKEGKNALALSEYIAAARSAPNNLFLRDQLANFYLRTQQYQDALEVWSNHLKDPSLDTFWVKALFWGNIVKPVDFDWDSATPPEGNQQPLVEYLLTLKSGEFWDQEDFNKIPEGSKYLQREQATFWLRLLKALKDLDEDSSWNLLQYNPFNDTSWHPELEYALKQVIAYRKTGSLDVNIGGTPDNETNKRYLDRERYPFFAELDDLSEESKLSLAERIPSSLHELLLSDQAFMATLLAAGWPEAALQLNTLTIVPTTFPNWISYSLTQALQKNRGAGEALEFATLQHPTSELSLLIGELLIAQGDADAGLDILSKLTDGNSDIAFRASWLSSLVYIEKGALEKAKELIEAQPKLKSDVVGKETLARIALLQGNLGIADKLYASLEKDSSEAKSYLARKAFAEKNWRRAKQLTEDLLKEHPNNQLLLENLKKIIQKQKQATGS